MLMIISLESILYCYKAYTLSKHLSLVEVLRFVIDPCNNREIASMLYQYLNNQHEVITIEEIQFCLEVIIPMFYKTLSMCGEITSTDKLVIRQLLNRSDVIIEREPP